MSSTGLESDTMRFLFFTLLLTTAGVLGAQLRNLDIYWIDTEGGAATLIVSPSGESMLRAIQHQVVVVNNGPRKGLGNVDNTAKSILPPGTRIAPYERNLYERIAKMPGVEGI